MIAAASCKLQQNANDGCNSCASLAGLVVCYIVVVTSSLVSFKFYVLSFIVVVVGL